MTAAVDTRACRDCGRPVSEHKAGLCPVCNGPLDHHPRRQPTPEEWRGRARMAHARQASGQPIGTVDRDAIWRHPDCPPLMEGWPV